MKYPTTEEVDTAEHKQICQWYRFLPSPTNAIEIAIMDRIVARFRMYGGFTASISKAAGWEE